MNKLYIPVLIDLRASTKRSDSRTSPFHETQNGIDSSPRITENLSPFPKPEMGPTAD
jgi:hypothetical protein